MLIKCGIVFMNCKQVVVRSHKKVPSIIKILHNGTTALDSKALVTEAAVREKKSRFSLPRIFKYGMLYTKRTV